SGADLVFSGTQTLDGNGQMVFAGTGTDSVIPTSGNFTIGKNITIRANHAGIIGSASVELLNRGTISAEAGGEAINIFGSRVRNQGTIEALNGGSLKVENLQNSASVLGTNGAALTLSGAWNNAGVLRIDAATVNLGGTFSLINIGTLVRSGGTINLSGTLE